jgi:hypothetical protein
MLINFFFLAVPGSLPVCFHDGKAGAVTQAHSQRNHNSRRLRGQGNRALSCNPLFIHVQNNVADPADPAFQVSPDPIPDLGFDDQN